MGMLTVKLDAKYKKGLDERWVNYKSTGYVPFFAGKSVVCEDHFSSPSGCQPTCPFSKFGHDKCGTGCHAWLETMAEMRGFSVSFPFQENEDWQGKAGILKADIAENIEWIGDIIEEEE